MHDDEQLADATAIEARWNGDEPLPPEGWAAVETGPFLPGDRILRGDSEFQGGRLAWYAVGLVVEQDGFLIGEGVTPLVRVIRRAQPLREATVEALRRVDGLRSGADAASDRRFVRSVLADYLTHKTEEPTER